MTTVDTRSRSSQVEQAVLRYIKTNKLETGNRLPSESEMGRMLGVSRNTVREGYIALEREGIILRRHGIGTIVLQSAPANTLYSARRSYPTMIRSSGHVPDITSLSRSYEPAPPDVIQAFGLGEPEAVLRVSRVVRADEIPAVYVVDYFSPAMPVSEHDWTWFDGDMVDFITHAIGARECRYHARIEALCVDETIAALLEIDTGTPVVVTKSVVYNLTNMNALVYTVNYQNPYAIDIEVSGVLSGNVQ